MIQIEYKKKSESMWSVLNIPKEYFQRNDEHCDEWVSEELREFFYAKIPDEDYEMAFLELEFKAGDWWNDVVTPIYEKYVEC